RLERAWRWARRNPRDAVIATLVAVLVLLGGAGAWWLERQAAEHRAELKQQAIREETERTFREQENRRQVLAALERAAALRRQYLWETAKGTLAAAADLLGATGPDDLRRQVRQAQKDLQMAARLDAIRLEKMTLVEGKLSFPTPAPAYAQAFKDHGLDIESGEVAALATDIATSAIKDELVAALDDWAIHEVQRAIWERLFAVAHQADPGGWQDQFRDPKVRQNLDALKKLAKEVDVSRLTPTVLVFLGTMLCRREMPEEGITLLRRAQRHYPS